MRRSLGVLLLAAAALAAPSAARADGAPTGPVVGGMGVASLDRTLRFVALDVPHGTLVESLDGNGAVQNWRVVHGRFATSTVATDGSTTGLAVDGGTLVLTGLGAFPYRQTHFAVLDTRTLRVRERVTLRGYFALDALSPDGGRLFLTHYTRPKADLGRYEVRAYDIARHRLGPHPIVDPREPDEKMLGIPFSRAMGDGGRWAYTLYVKGDGSAFVHALDTARSRAFCVDLDGIPAAQDMRVTAPPDGPIRIVGDGRTLALVDRRTFTVSRPAPHRPLRPATASGGDGAGWILPLAGLGLLAAVAGARRRYVRSASFRNAS